MTAGKECADMGLETVSAIDSLFTALVESLRYSGDPDDGDEGQSESYIVFQRPGKQYGLRSVPTVDALLASYQADGTPSCTELMCP